MRRHRLRAIVTAVAAGLVVGALASASVAAEEPAAAAYERARTKYYALKGSEARKRYRHNWIGVIAAFREVSVNYPDSDRAPRALYTAGELWRGLYEISRRPGDLDQAVVAYGRVADEYAASSLADDARWQRARIFERRGEEVEAAREVRVLLEQFPAGDMAERARAMAKRLEHVAVPEQPASAPEQRQVTGTATSEMRTVTGVEHWSHPDSTRVAVYVSGAVRARSGRIPARAAPDGVERLYVDIDVASLTPSVASRTEVDDGLVSAIRIAQFQPEVVRVVLELQSAASHRVLLMENPSRVVVDALTAGKGKAAPEPAGPVGQNDARTLHVVLDPGHGGKDVGASSAGGLREKDVVLKLAAKTAERLRKAGVKVTLTRDDDTYLPLDGRATIANKLGADAFVSIHANSAKNKSARGIETYYLDVTNDRYAIRLAAVENQTSEDSVSDLQLILADLSTKANIPASMALAKRVQAGLVKAARPLNSKTRDLGVKGSLFYVLLGARMPAILVEASFLSHPVEGKLLAKETYIDALAGALSEALVSGLADTTVGMNP